MPTLVFVFVSVSVYVCVCVSLCVFNVFFNIWSSKVHSGCFLLQYQHQHHHFIRCLTQSFSATIARIQKLNVVLKKNLSSNQPTSQPIIHPSIHPNAIKDQRQMWIIHNHNKNFNSTKKKRKEPSSSWKWFFFLPRHDNQTNRKNNIGQMFKYLQVKLFHSMISSSSSKPINFYSERSCHTH